MNTEQEAHSLIEDSIEQRADYIPTNRLFEETSDSSDLFKIVHKALLSSALKTIVGPRGCGKTHMMRHAWLTCQQDDAKPFAVYVSFNKYYRLEPLLIARSSPPDEFQSWALGLIVLATYESSAFRSEDGKKIVQDLETAYNLPKKELEAFVSALERNQPLSDDQKQLARAIDIRTVQKIIDQTCTAIGRRRTILLLDDAALTLTPPYLIELLDIIRSLKSSTIAPKASVYPGTTEYSPRFHTGQDTMHVYAWISVENTGYDTDMDNIAKARIKLFDAIPSDVVKMLRFASFGIPRAFLTMLQEFKEMPSGQKQKSLNVVIENHYNGRIAEFRSIATKVPKLRNIVDAGETVLNGMVKAIKSANDNSSTLQLVIGVNKDELTPMIERMFQTMVEAGIVYDAKEVKHGTPERIYRRYLPHTAALLQSRALTGSDSGGAISGTLASLGKKRAKHPVRQRLSSIINDSTLLSNLKFSLPPCQKCSTPRVSDTQKFCTNCGNQLVAVSTFDACLNVKIADVPGLTNWQKTKINEELKKLGTIRDYLAMQDPATELKTIYGFGPQKSMKIADLLKSFVDDFLS